jgi:hypothetical protein
MTTAVNPSKPGSKTGVELHLHMYRRMLMIRSFEEHVNDLYTRALMPGLAHLYIGEEAVAVGVCEALRPRRLHHQHASRPRALPGEGSGARSDVRRAAGQRSGLLQGQRRLDAHRRSRHRQPRRERDRGGSAGIATGAAFSAQRLGLGKSRVLLWRGRAGPGSSLRSDEHGALWKLPVIYVCENNMYNEYTHFSETTAGDILMRAAGVRVPAEGRGRPGRPRRLRDHEYGWSSERGAARGPGVSWWQYLPVHGPSRGRHQPRILSFQAGRAAVENRARSQSRFIGDWLSGAGHGRPPQLDQDSERKSKRRWTRRCKFAIAAPYPDSSTRWTEDVYA